MTYQDRPFFVQPFIDNVQSEGEYSLFFFDGVYSHAILKTPEQGDFRSQEEHGAEVRSADATAEQIDAAEKLLSLVEPQQLPLVVGPAAAHQAADFVPVGRGRPGRKA